MAIERRLFGRSGHESSRILFGAAALKQCDQGVADRVLDLLFEYGVNHIDTAPRYGDAELRIGPWMARHRNDFFLATKTDQRSYDGAREQIRRSLDRLQTDHVDLMQMHALFHLDEWDQAMGEDGALRASVEARDEGLVRFIGVTGHGWTVPAMHRRSLERFDFDSVLMPWNWQMAGHRGYGADFQRTREMCRQRNVAVQTIKSIARGAWAAGAEQNRSTWYQPLEDEDDIRAAVHWVLAEEDLFLNSVGDTDLLPLVLKAADQTVIAPTEAAMSTLSDRAGLATIFGI
ncbi:MAG: aldo/keto reductase [Paracoccaceae bacterium]